MLKKVLIANRGEIAIRIIRACRDLGIISVAIYSKEDSSSMHVQLADERICIGSGPVKNSYLNQDSIITAAINKGADAIHPGYGFLSENAAFARKCRECGLVFIGPDPEVIDSMGNKSQARKTMMQAGVPVVPGTLDPVYDLKTAKKQAEELGFPIMIKASSGGGGRGMRQAMSMEEFEDQFDLAQRESANAFGDDAMYLERLVLDPRHVESPSPAINQATRKKMHEAAVLAAKTAGYTSAGTVEFIVDKNGDFYFMEMNTRIQVEHGVSEMVTGTDLVCEQLRIASGLPLSFTQRDIKMRGHAIECRINAEIPEKNFMPSPGKVNILHLPGGNGVRVDTALCAPDRKAAIMKMRGALNETLISGIETNLDLQFRIMHNKVFCEGRADTGFVAKFISGGK